MKEVVDHSYVLLNLAALVIVLGAIRITEPIISPLLIALFISAISSPAMFWLVRKNIPQGLALSIVILGVFLIGGLIFNIVGSSLSHFISELPIYQVKLTQLSQQFIPQLAEFGVVVEPDEIHKVFDLGAIMGFVGKTFSGVLNTLTNAFLIFLLVIFILIEFASFGEKLKRISQKPEQFMQSLEQFSEKLNRYITLKSLMSLLTAIPIMLVLSRMGINYPVLWGFLVFVLNFIPNVGSILAAIPVVLLALVQPEQGVYSALIVMMLFIVVNNVVGNIIEPRLMGKSLGLSSLVVFISLVFWGWLLGTVGMFLSIPLTMSIKIALDSHPKLGWISILLGNQDECVDKESRFMPLKNLLAVHNNKISKEHEK